MNDLNEYADAEINSDEELQEAFAAGLLKPGLNSIRKVQKREKINNKEGLVSKLEEFKLNLPWIERLDLTNKPAPLAPEMAYQEDVHAKHREKILSRLPKNKMNLGEDVIHNDFKREMLFYRQAQAAVLEGLARLKSMGIKTKRPDDYFAQMAKSDHHMQKIRQKLVSKQSLEERLEKIRKLRELKKYGKQVQIEVQRKRQSEKKAMLDQVKKFRAGKSDKIDFLDEDRQGKKTKLNTKGGKLVGKPSDAKRQRKDKKFGFGGKKRGLKNNTKSSLNEMSYGNGSKRVSKKKVVKRLGKNRRKQNRLKKKF